MAVEFSQIHRSISLSEEVASLVKESIINGAHNAGDPLPSENALALQFGVSRIVIREALKELKSKGFIETRRGPKGGAYVREIGRLTFGEHFSDLVRMRQLTIKDLFQARILIEPEVVRLFLKKTTDDQIADLRQLVIDAEEADDRLERKELNLEFHRRLGHLSGNPFYALLMNSFMDFVDRFLAIINPATYNLHDNQSHHQITEAIADRDEARALSLVQAHLLDTRDKMVNLESYFLEQSGRARNLQG
jgi:GntR family transcriptional regulator, transcriptional repressor for pyruvate dehydrogenase complex